MLTDERRRQLSDVLRPAALPVEVDGVYTDDQKRRPLDVVRTEGPWELITAQHFASADELIATLNGCFVANDSTAVWRAPARVNRCQTVASNRSTFWS